MRLPMLHSWNLVSESAAGSVAFMWPLPLPPQVPRSVVSSLLLLHCGLSSSEYASHCKGPAKLWSSKQGIAVGTSAVVRWPVGDSGVASWSEGVVLGVDLVRSEVTWWLGMRVRVHVCVYHPWEWLW